MKKLPLTATNSEIIDKINEIISKMNSKVEYIGKQPSAYDLNQIGKHLKK